MNIKLSVGMADEIVAHWSAVNNAINPDVKLSGNYGITSFVNDRITLVSLMDQLVAQENVVEGLMATRDSQRLALLARMRQFNSLVRGLFPGSQYARMLPELGRMTSAPKIWMVTTADIANIWAQIDAITPAPPGTALPLQLAGGYSRSDFTTDAAALLASFNAMETALAGRYAAIQARDAKWGEMRARIVQYRRTIQGRLAADSALCQSLPRLSPKYKPRPKKVAVEEAAV